jgi:hypothetical protein
LHPTVLEVATVPALHTLQLVCFMLFWYFPTAQLLQLVLLTSLTYLPMLQSLHVSWLFWALY